MLKKILPTLIRILLSGLLVWLLSLKIPLEAVWRSIHNIKVEWFWLSVVLGEVVMLQMAIRWKRLLLVSEENKPPLSTFFRYTAIGYFFNLFLPTGFGGDIVKSWLFGKKQQEMAASVVSTALARVLGLLSLVVLFWVGVFITGRFEWVSMTAMFGFFLAIIIVIVVSMNESVLERVKRNDRILFKYLGSFLDKVHEYRNHISLLRLGFLDSVLMQFLLIVIQWCFFKASGAELSILELLVLIPVVTIATMVPLSFYGIGLREWAILTFLPIGYDHSLVLAGVALGYGLVLIQALQGAIFLGMSRIPFTQGSR